MNGSDDTDSGLSHSEAWPIALEGSSPNWMEDGYGIQGPQGESEEEDLQDWDTNAWSDNSQANEDFASVGNTGLEVGTQAFYGGYLGNVNNVTEIHFDESMFLIQDDGGGNVLVSLNTTTCP
jgi:hypothetical protein